VELERLKMVLEQNMLTPWVRQNGFGGIDEERFSKAIDQIGLAVSFKKKPQVDDVFTDEYLPSIELRKID
jgi:NitT/TauT family transport system substrate-binding protein